MSNGEGLQFVSSDNLKLNNGFHLTPLRAILFHREIRVQLCIASYYVSGVSSKSRN